MWPKKGRLSKAVRFSSGFDSTGPVFNIFFEGSKFKRFPESALEPLFGDALSEMGL